MFACVHIPEFMVQAALRGEPDLRGRMLALLEGTHPQCRVVAASAAALRAGIAVGMAEAQAEQFAGVQMRMRSPQQEQNAHAALLDLGGAFSPRVEDTAPDSIILDLAGLDALLGGAESIARQLAAGAQNICGMEAHVAVAGNPDTALHAARGLPGVTVIAEGEETARLGPLPLGVLGASAEALETLERWGVRTCAALAALPLPELSERLGAEGVRLHQWARGAGQRALRLVEPALRFEETLELDYEVAELEPLAFLLSRMLKSLCARLQARSLAAGAVKMRLALTPPSGRPGVHVHERVLRLPVPMRDARLLLNLLRLQLQGAPPGDPVRGIFLAAESAPLRATQGGFFTPPQPDAETLELTLAKLAHLVGESRVGAPELVDTHRPDTFRIRRFGAATTEKNPFSTEHSKKQTSEKPQVAHKTGRPELQKTGEQAIPHAAFRAFRPAVAARVEMREGQPARVFFRGMRGKVVAASGPWRSSGDWWEKEAWQEEEWELEIEFSVSRQISRPSVPTLQEPERPARRRQRWRGVYRVVYDAIRCEWLVRGVFD